MVTPVPLRRSRRAFTLIELLTVLAIIGILTAILIPTVGAVRRSAANSRDTSNLRQIGAGIHLHVADNNGMLPINTLPILGMDTPPPSGAIPNADWNFQEAVDRYLSDRWRGNRNSFYRHRGNEIWYSQFAEAYSGFVPNASTGQSRPIAYGYNPNVLNTTHWRGRMSAVRVPSRTVIAGEVNDRQRMDPNNPPTTAGNVQSGYRVNRDGKALYLFVDGRVAMLAGDQSHNTLRASGQDSLWAWW